MRLTASQKRELILSIATYIVSYKCTVRQAAKKYNLSKTTIHKYMTKELPKISNELHEYVKQVFDLNKEERHIRGGQATKLKFLSI
jgi:Stage III sporulation protein D.